MNTITAHTPRVSYYPQLILLIPLLFPLSACALSGNALEGQVLEEETSRPILSAIVVVRWSGHLATFAHGKTVCYHVESAITDDQGRYRIPAWKMTITEDWQKNIRPETVIVTAYKPGYETHSTPGYARSEEFKRNVRYLKPFAGGREERLKYLLHLSGLVSCNGAGDERTLVPVYKALYDDAKTIVTSDKDKDVLQPIRRRALYAWTKPSRELTTREIEQAIQNDPYLREQFQ
jgi:hypothetical protein